MRHQDGGKEKKQGEKRKKEDAASRRRDQIAVAAPMGTEWDQW
jgi:hypothetical protein